MTEISIIFSTKSKENASNLLRSIQKVNSYDVVKDYSLSIVILDKTDEQDIEKSLSTFDFYIDVISLQTIQVLEQKRLDLFETANCSLKIDSIQRARVQQQIYILENFKRFTNSVIWQVDDDMLFGQSEYLVNKHIVNYSINYFSKIIELYHQNKNIDAIISPSTYVPPIPSLLYCETQLNDFFYNKYIPENTLSHLEYHDYYNQSKCEKDYSIFLSKENDKTTIVKNILKGIPITRVSQEICSGSDINLKPSKLLRGGNFIVFNPYVFQIPHLGYKENDFIPARRSDMIHCNLLSELDFQIKDVSYFRLVHNRTFSNYCIERISTNYYSDMIGALLMAFLHKGEDEFKSRLQFHQNHIKNILKLLCENVDVNEFRAEIEKLLELDFKINSFDQKIFINEIQDFKKSKEELKIRLCKLAL